MNKAHWIFHIFIKSIYKLFTCIVTEMKIEQQKLMHWHNIEYLHTSKIKEMLFLDDDLKISQHEIDVCLWWRFDSVSEDQPSTLPHSKRAATRTPVQWVPCRPSPHLYRYLHSSRPLFGLWLTCSFSAVSFVSSHVKNLEVGPTL